MALKGVLTLTFPHRHTPTDRIDSLDPRASLGRAQEPVEEAIAGGGKRVAGRSWRDGQQLAHQSG